MSFQFFDLFSYLSKEICDRLGGDASEAVHERITGFRVEFDGGDPCAILSPVMLFFHQEVQLVQAVERTPLLLHVVGEWLPEADECEAAFMLDGITHNCCKCIANIYWPDITALLNAALSHIYFFTIVPKERWMLSHAWNSLSTMM